MESEEEKEEEKDKQDEQDEQEEEGRGHGFTEEDIREFDGELERREVFGVTFADLLPPQEGPLSNYWKQKLESMEQEI